MTDEEERSEQEKTGNKNNQEGGQRIYGVTSHTLGWMSRIKDELALNGDSRKLGTSGN